MGVVGRFSTDRYRKLAPFGQVIAPGEDGAPFGPNDAQLVLSNGTTRLYIMRLSARGLAFDRITRLSASRNASRRWASGSGCWPWRRHSRPTIWRPCPIPPPSRPSASQGRSHQAAWLRLKVDEAFADPRPTVTGPRCIQAPRAHHAKRVKTARIGKVSRSKSYAFSRWAELTHQPRPEEARSAVSKDGNGRGACGPCSRRSLRDLLSMRLGGGEVEDEVGGVVKTGLTVRDRSFGEVLRLRLRTTCEAALPPSTLRLLRQSDLLEIPRHARMQRHRGDSAARVLAAVVSAGCGLFAASALCSARARR